MRSNVAAFMIRNTYRSPSLGLEVLLSPGFGVCALCLVVGLYLDVQANYSTNYHFSYFLHLEPCQGVLGASCVG